MTAHRSSKFDSSVTYQWDTGVNFSGFLLVGYVLPGTRVTIAIGQQYTPILIPIFTRFKITDGVPSQEPGLIYTTDLNPPNVKYVAWLYDDNNVQILGPSSLFTVTAATFSPTFSPSTITAPAAGSTTPTPN